MNKNNTLLTALGLIILLCLTIAGYLFFGGEGGAEDSSRDSSSQTLAVVTDPADSSVAPSEPNASSIEEDDSSTATGVDQTQGKTYTFRSKKLFDQHFEKHGAEFGDITQEDYLRMANELINSKADTVLSKTEKEDGDFVFFDTETGRFAVLSQDGYIRTFFIPDQGIKYYNKQ